MRIGLISCASGKLDKPAPAKDLYTTDLFKKAQAYAIREYGRYFILSAKYGLVHPEAVIKPYDETLTVKSKLERVDWAKHVAAALMDRYPPGTEVYIHAGKHYRDDLIPLLEAAGYPCKVPLEGKQIGEQLSFYKQALAGR